MKTVVSSFVAAMIVIVAAAGSTFAAASNFNSGIGRSGNSALNISAETPGPIKYKLEFKPLGGSRQVSESTYDNSSSNFATSVNVKCLDGGECSKDDTYVRGVYIVGTEGAYAVAKKFTLFCGSIQVVGEQKTDTWDGTFYTSFADDFLTNGPSTGNCPSPSATPVAATVTPSSASNLSPTTSTTKLKRSPTPEPTEEEKDKDNDKDAEETPTPTPEEEGTSFVDSFTQNLPLYIAGAVLLGVLGYVLYKKNPKFNAFVTKTFKKKPKSSPPPNSEPPSTTS